MLTQNIAISRLHDFYRLIKLLDNIISTDERIERAAEQNLSLAFTTYQAGKLFFIGLQAGGKLSVFERTFERCMGLWAGDSTLYMNSLYQLWRFENVLEPGQTHNGYDQQ